MTATWLLAVCESPLIAKDDTLIVKDEVAVDRPYGGEQEQEDRVRPFSKEQSDVTAKEALRRISELKDSRLTSEEPDVRLKALSDLLRQGSEANEEAARKAVTATANEEQEAKPKAVDEELTFCGRWITQTGKENMVGLEAIQWHEGGTSRLTALNPQRTQLETELYGQTFTAELTLSGTLLWSDGDVWVRNTQKPVTGAHRQCALGYQAVEEFLANPDQGYELLQEALTSVQGQMRSQLELLERNRSGELKVGSRAAQDHGLPTEKPTDDRPRAPRAKQRSRSSLRRSLSASGPRADGDLARASSISLLPPCGEVVQALPADMHEATPTLPARHQLGSGAPTPEHLPSVSVQFELASVDYATLEQEAPEGHGKTLNLMMLNASRIEDGWRLQKQARRGSKLLNEEVLRAAVKAAVEGILASLDSQKNVTRTVLVHAATGDYPRGTDSEDNHVIGVAFQPGPAAAAAASEDEGSLLQEFTADAFGDDARPRPPPRRRAALLNRQRRLGGRRHAHQHSTFVQVDIVDRPGTGADRVNCALEVLTVAEASGALEEALTVEIEEATDVDAEIGPIVVSKAVVVQWDLTKCAAHVRGIVASFSKAYTRAQVPGALYHACTTFAAKASFSHDPIINSKDKRKCHAATERLSQLWQYGHGDLDYSDFCNELCQVKYGEDALRCKVEQFREMRN